MKIDHDTRTPIGNPVPFEVIIHQHIETEYTKRNLFAESFGVHVFLCNFAPHFGVEYSLNCEEYLSHALYNAPVSVENKNSLPDKPRIFNPTVCRRPHEEIQTEV